MPSCVRSISVGRRISGFGRSSAGSGGFASGFTASGDCESAIDAGPMPIAAPTHGSSTSAWIAREAPMQMDRGMESRFGT